MNKIALPKAAELDPASSPVDSAADSETPVKRKRGRPRKLDKERPDTSTKRVKRFRQNRIAAGGSELSLFLPPEASVALEVIRAVKSIRHKVNAASRALIAEAQRLAPNEARVKELVQAEKLAPQLAKDWLKTLKTLQVERDRVKQPLDLRIRKKAAPSSAKTAAPTEGA
jgi:hypothetical protein